MIIYYMVFATDHPTGTKIMSDLYAAAATEFPAMRTAARGLRQRQEAEAAGLYSLFGDEELAHDDPPRAGERFYEHQPPWRPWFLD